MVVERPSFETCHRKDRGLLASIRLSGSEFGKVEGSKTGIEMEVQLFDIAGLAIPQSSELLGITKDEFDLKA